MTDVRDFFDRGDDWVRFGVGAESETASLLRERGARRVLLVCQGHHREGADRLAKALGSDAAVFAGVTRQVPEAVVLAALEHVDDHGADWVVAHGGGSAVGLAKALALSRPVELGAVPTTYAGSERTRIYGLLRGGHKVTGRDPRVRPGLVVYDPELTRHLPRETSLFSLLNALAHAVEALYAVEATPSARSSARDALGPLMEGMEGIARDPQDARARVEATYGAYRASEALDGASMALHHKLAHVLGGSFGTPHAPTHAILLPYTLAFNAPAAADTVAALGEAWGVEDAVGHLHARMRAWGLPTSLRHLGLGEADLRRASSLAVQKTYPNPRPLDEAAFQRVLEAAFAGDPSVLNP